MSGAGPGTEPETAREPETLPYRYAEFRALTSRAGQVRRIIAAYLRYWGLGSLIESAGTGATELLGRAAGRTEADGDCTVAMVLAQGRLTLSVRVREGQGGVDGAYPADGAGVPDPARGQREMGDAGEASRGHGLVTAADTGVSRGTGALREEPGALVWCALPVDADGGTYRADGTRRTEAALLG